MPEPFTLQERIYKKGSIVWMENSKAMPYFFILKSGQLRQFFRLMDEEEVTVHGKGDTFGLIGCLTGHNYVDRLIAVEDSTVIMIKTEELIPFLAHRSEIFLKIVGDYSNRLRNINQKLFQLCSRGNYEDVPRHFLDIAEYFKAHKLDRNAVYAYRRYLAYGDDQALKTAVAAEIKAAEARVGTPLPPESFTPQRQGAKASYRGGEIIFLEQEKGDEFYFIESGKVKISHIDKSNEYVIAVLRSGEFFGEMAILNQEERNASAIAFENTRLLVLNKDTIMQSLGVEILKKVFTSLAKRMWYSYRRSINLSYKNPVLRLYDCLDFIIESKSGQKRENSYFFDINFHDLRGMTNTLDVEDSKIRDFLNDENIKLNYGTVSIINLSKYTDTLKVYRSREHTM
ncbi:MAG: cyclic nucleotide-binding domain-containing protein [Spirochaetales bacterium]|nr:cyclic nucleotide-binding domain-containing protein [Spirochaetales bacterium]